MARTDAERWDRWSRTYDRGLSARFLLRPLYARLLATARPRPGEILLDVGAGTGTVVALARERGTTAFGVDPSEGMVGVARTKAPGRFVVAAAERLPFGPERFDLVTTSMSTHHWRSAEEGFAEIARVLKPTGRAVLADISRSRVLGRLLDLVRFGHAARYLAAEERDEVLRATQLIPVSHIRFRRRILITLAERRAG